jgi:ubiquinone/menaquinone biosynthesis C-methylase UbiE
MSDHVCPWWLGYALDNPLRRILHKPEKILAGLVGQGDTAVDIGCGMGFFSLAMARMVGDQGRVLSVDLQPEMLDMVRRRAEGAGLLPRIHTHHCRSDTIGIEQQVDFVLAFWMVHEVPDRRAFLREVRAILKPEARFLLVEPKVHVPPSSFGRIVEEACGAGMKVCSENRISLSRAVLFTALPECPPASWGDEWLEPKAPQGEALVQ